MRKTLLLAAAVSMCLLAKSALADDLRLSMYAVTDGDSLDGAWRLLESKPIHPINLPKENETDWSMHNGKVRFESLHAAGMPDIHPRGAEATYTLNETANPATIDLTKQMANDTHGVLKGIYQRVGDVLIVCLAQPGEDRPTQFMPDAKKGQQVLVFWRKAAAEK